MSRKLLWGGVLSLLAVVLVALWWARAGGGAAQAPSAESAEPTLVLAALDVAVVAPGRLQARLPIAGTVEAARQATVRARSGGFAAGLNKRAGDPVRAGETVLLLQGLEPTEGQAVMLPPPPAAGPAPAPAR